MNWIKKLLGINEIQSKLNRIDKFISSFEMKKKTDKSRDFKSLNLLNPVLETNIFSIEKFDQIIPIEKKELILNNPCKILQALSSVSEFISAGLLSQSFRFKLLEVHLDSDTKALADSDRTTKLKKKVKSMTRLM